MPTASEVNQSIRMTLEFQPPFPLDLIVRTPAKLRRRLADGSSFLQQIVTHGKVLYEERNRPLGQKSRGRPHRRKRSGAAPWQLHDLICFHCQQSAERYPKALLIELEVPIPKTHRLDDLRLLLLPHDASLEKLRRALVTLARYAVDYRYPDENAM